MKSEVITAIMAMGLLSAAMIPASAQPHLTEAARSDSMIWNGVAVAGGRTFVSGPRWTGSKGPAVGVLDGHGRPVPYPDAAWNAWQPGADAAHAFVDVNAIHLDGKGSLWAVDTGSPKFGGNPLPGGAKLVQIDLATDKVVRVIAFGPDIALPGSYVDDIRFHGGFTYSTDAGKPGIIVVDLATGAMRRVLENAPSTTAPANRPIVVDGKPVLAPDGTPLKVNADPMEVSPDGRWFYFGPLEGPWSRIETRWLEDAAAGPETVAGKVEPWAGLPPTGGTAMDANGGLYFSDLASNSLKRRAVDGTISTVIQDPGLHWIDAMAIDAEHRIWMPVPQMDRVAAFHDGRSEVRRPVALYRLSLPSAP